MSEWKAEPAEARREPSRSSSLSSLAPRESKDDEGKPPASSSSSSSSEDRTIQSSSRALARFLRFRLAATTASRPRATGRRRFLPASASASA